MPQLYSELQLVEALMPDTLAQGEAGYFFVTMMAVVEYLLSVGVGSIELHELP